MEPQSKRLCAGFMLLLYELLPIEQNKGELFLLSPTYSRLMEWRAVKAKKVLSGLLSVGWSIKRQRGSHKILAKAGYPDFTFAFHDREEIGPRMLARIAKHTGLVPDDL